MKYLFRGGRGTRRADILVEGEKILEVGRNITRKADQIIDVTGMLLMPGFIDAHTHFDLDVCNTTTADNFTTGSRAALRGGTTTVVDFACPNKGESLHHGLELWHRKADGRTCRADVFERCRRRKSRCGAKFSDELPPVECVKKVDIARPAVQNGNRQFAVN